MTPINRTAEEMTDEERIKKEREAVEQILGKPFAAAVSDATEQIRRNL